MISSANGALFGAEWRTVIRRRRGLGSKSSGCFCHMNMLGFVDPFPLTAVIRRKCRRPDGADGANLPNRYSALCWRPATHAQTWASYSALYRFGRLSKCHATPSRVNRFMKQTKRLKSSLQRRGSVRVYKIADGADGRWGLNYSKFV